MIENKEDLTPEQEQQLKDWIEAQKKLIIELNEAAIQHQNDEDPLKDIA